MNLSLAFLHQHENLLNHGGLEALIELLHLPENVEEFLAHFVMDSLSLFAILVVVMFGVSLLQTYIPFERMQSKLSALSSVWGYLLAIGLGVVSPFCSCTIIPVVMGMLSMGVPVQVTLCYLTSAALLNGGTVLTLFSSQGAQFGMAYVVAAIVTAVGTSLLIKPFSSRENVICYDMRGHNHCHDHCDKNHSHGKKESRLRSCWDNVWDVLREIWLYMLFSVALSSAVLCFVPIEMLNHIIGRQNLLSPLIAGVVGAPIHADVFTILPMVQLLRPINSAATMAFTLGTLAISIPEVVLLGKVFRPKTIAVYSGILILFSVGIGYLLVPFAG